MTADTLKHHAGQTWDRRGTDGASTVSYLLSATRGQRWGGLLFCFSFECSVSSVLIWPPTSFSTTASTSSPERWTRGGQAQKGPPPLVREPPDWLSSTPQLSCEPPELWWCRHPAAALTSSSSGLCPSSGPSDPEGGQRETRWSETTVVCSDRRSAVCCSSILPLNWRE